MTPKKKTSNNADILRAFSEGLDSLAKVINAINKTPDSQYQSDPRQRILPQEATYSGIDPFQLLGLNANATAEQLKARYRMLMKVYHPDSGAGDDTMAKLINQAVEEIYRRKGW